RTAAPPADARGDLRAHDRRGPARDLRVPAHDPAREEPRAAAASAREVELGSTPGFRTAGGAVESPPHVPNSISTELAGFLESGISVLVGSRDARLMPEVARAFGARVVPGGNELVVYLPVATAARTLANARENGRLAVCFSAVDHRSYQVKGRLLEVLDAGDEDRRRIETYRAGLAQHYGFVGMPPKLTYRIAHWPAHAVRMAVEAIFLQTPGPGAGGALG